MVCPSTGRGKRIKGQSEKRAATFGREGASGARVSDEGDYRRVRDRRQRNGTAFADPPLGLLADEGRRSLLIYPICAATSPGCKTGPTGCAKCFFANAILSAGKASKFAASSQICKRLSRPC